jgi:hypothetical protein
MDPATLTLIPGILGGLAIAWLISRLHARHPSTLPVPEELAISTDVINIAHIRAAGVGGLGLFAMAIVVAVFVPGIRLAVGAGVLSGVALGVVMILRGRRTDPLPSSGGSAGANTILSIDRRAGASDDETRKAEQSDKEKLNSAAAVA